MKIVCVLKSGGDFGPSDVIRLRQCVRGNVTRAHSFICYTDHNGGYVNGIPAFTLEGITIRPLRKRWPGWWAKLEAFREPGPTLYLDLDTVVVANIDSLINRIQKLGKMEMLMLTGFSKNRLASGIMGWSDRSAAPSLLFGQFALDLRNFQTIHGVPHAWIWGKCYRGDQDWIVEALSQLEITIIRAQSVIPEICSYKHHCRDGLPPDTRIICFHGRPRPTELMPRPEWLCNVWGPEIINTKPRHPAGRLRP